MVENGLKSLEVAAGAAGFCGGLVYAKRPFLKTTLVKHVLSETEVSKTRRKTTLLKDQLSKTRRKMTPLKSKPSLNTSILRPKC